MRRYLIDTATGLQLELNYEAAPNRYLTDFLGRPMYDRILVGRLYAPSQPKSVIVHEMERTSKSIADDGSEKEVTRKRFIYDRFVKQIDDFKSGTGNPAMSGTPVANLPGVDVRMNATLESLGIFTVESLAAAGDNVLPLLGLNYDLRRRAREYVEGSKDTARFTQLNAENEQLKSKLAGLEMQVAELAKNQGNLQSRELQEQPGAVEQFEARRGPGRPRKDA